MEACNEHTLVCFTQHAMIEFFNAKGVSAIEIHCWKQVVYGDDSVDCVYVSTVRHRAKNVRMANRKGLICVINKEVDDMWHQLMSFTSKRLMNWLRTIDRLLKGKLLSGLAFHRNVWVTWLMFFSIRRFVQDGFLACWRQRWKLWEVKFASKFCHTMRTKMRNFFTIWWQLMKHGCIIMNPKSSVQAISSQKFTCKKNSKTQLGQEKSWLQFLGMQMVLYTLTSLNHHQLRALHCNTQNLETIIKKSLEANKDHFAATWQC